MLGLLERKGEGVEDLGRAEPDELVGADIDVEPERILLRGTDSETLEELTALSEGYRALPEFPGFVRIDAGGGQDEVLAALTAAINAATSTAIPETSAAGPDRISAK